MAQYPVDMQVASDFGTTNHSDWYNVGGRQLLFPSLNVALTVYAFDENACGMVGNIDPSVQPTYEIISPTLVTIRFACLAHGLGLTGDWYWGVWWKQTGNESYHDGGYGAERAGSTVVRQIPVEITCLLDIFSLGVPVGQYTQRVQASIIG